jgi:hypothetical protein
MDQTTRRTPPVPVEQVEQVDPVSTMLATVAEEEAEALSEATH